MASYNDDQSSIFSLAEPVLSPDSAETKCLMEAAQLVTENILRNYECRKKQKSKHITSHATGEPG
jgi:hypothetical protein